MAKNNEEKVIIRKCHHCGKPLDQDKNFCLHCGHVYQEIDKEAVKAARRGKAKKFWIKFAIYGSMAAVLAVIILLIVQAALKSDHFRVVEYLKEEGATETEGVYRINLKEEPDKNATTYVTCTDADTESFVLVYEEKTETFDTIIKVFLTVADTSSYNWECSFVYHDDKQQAYNFEETYTGTLDPSVFTTKEGEVSVNIPVPEPSEDETQSEIQTDTESDESETETEAEELAGRIGTIIAMAGDYLEPDGDYLEPLPDEEESESETETETETEEEETETETEEEDPIDPEADIREAARRVVTLQVRQMIYELYVFINQNGLLANLEGLGFTAYYEYIEQLNPLKR